MDRREPSFALLLSTVLHAWQRALDASCQDHPFTRILAADECLEVEG